MANTPPILPPIMPVSTAPAAVTGQQNPPPLPQLPAGTVLLGAVTGKDNNGNAIIKTEALRLVLNTHYPLKKNAQVAVRLESTLTATMEKTTPQHVRIVSVDGKTAQPAPVSVSASTVAKTPANTPPAPPNSSLITNSGLAKPVALLMDIMSRPTAEIKADAKAPPEAPRNTARGVASEVNISPANTKATAVLLRPATTQSAAQLLTQLSQQIASPTPTTPQTLQSGLQMDVRITAGLITSTAQSSAKPESVVAPSSSTKVPVATTATMSGQVSTPPAAGSAAHMRSGYASYAKQAPNPQTATAQPTPPALSNASLNSTAIPTTSSPSLPASATSASTTPADRTPVTPQQPYVSTNASQQSPPPASAPNIATNNMMQSSSAATSVNIPNSLTPQKVEQILTRAEAQPLPAGNMHAVVMGKEPGGALIVQTRLGMFSLPAIQAANTTPGSVISWQVQTIQMPAAPALGLTPTTGLLATAASMTNEWAALEELTSLLQSMQTTMAAHNLQRIVPHIGSNMGAGLMLFINMLRKGDVTEWLGSDLIEQLEIMGKGELVQRLGADLASVRSLFVDQPQNNWQALFFPVMVENKLEHAQMFIKDNAQDKKKGGSGTRFIVELDLSNLGPMQMDGFIKKRESVTQFDLVLRTLVELPETIKTDISGIFNTAQQVTGLDGSLNFRLVPEFPVHPLEEMQAERNKSGDSGSILA
ncbi:MAG: hypothetical protein MK052_08220 [Alphaproteobacteria bacterium]|nr:hypothetical protein [Alphaproteobacteria bacterium]